VGSVAVAAEKKRSKKYISTPAKPVSKPKPPSSQTPAIKPASIDTSSGNIMSASLVTRDLAIRKRTLTLGKNDSFIEMLLRLGFNQRQLNSLGTRLAREAGFVFTSARVGQQIIVTERIEGNKRKILAIDIPTNKYMINISKTTGGQIQITKTVKGDAPDLSRSKYFYKAGTVQSTIAALGSSLNIPSSVTGKAIRVLNGKTNTSQIRSGDRLEVLYEYTYNKAGQQTGIKLLYVSLLTKGQRIEGFRFSTNGKDTGEFFDANGNSFTKSMLASPLRGRHKITSGFGGRRHPIFGRRMNHTGVDFKAKHGEPVYAAGDGTIDKFGRHSGYGNFIRIKHDGTWSTAYAHLSKYGKTMKLWKRVKKGELIGYAGSTGRSTGPHLHFELIKNGVAINPLKAKLPVGGKKLIAKDLYNFKQEISRIRNLVANNKR
jgi:murein DD-endopeptidase MepM/ murein hydrolase activator NlpD